jgi:hypothetical protein
MGRTMSHWMLNFTPQQSKTKQKYGYQITEGRCANEHQFSESKMSLSRRGRIQSKRYSTINIPQYFLLATE